MNLEQTIRRILREEFSKESFVPGVWGDEDNNYSIDRLVKLVKDREPTTMSIDKIINKNYDLETKEGNFKDNIEKPTKLFKQRAMEANTEYPVMISEEGWIIDGSHRIAKQKWDGIKKVKVHIISKEDLKKCKITDPKELKKSKEIKY